MNNFFTTEVPKILSQIDPAEYSDTFQGSPVIHVWVNPPRSILFEYNKMQIKLNDARLQIMRVSKAGKLNQWNPTRRARIRLAGKNAQEASGQLSAWLSVIWSQHPDESTHVTPGDVERAQEKYVQVDPKFWGWLISQTAAKILEHNTPAELEKN